MASPAASFGILPLSPPLGARPVAPVASPSGGTALPESARTLLVFLQAGPRTHKEIVTGAGLPARTARFAVERLRRAALVDEVPSLRDARQSYYRVRGGGLGEPQVGVSPASS